MTVPQTPGPGRNPGPRPALRRDNPDAHVVVARPGVGATPGTPLSASSSAKEPAKSKGTSKDKPPAKSDPPQPQVDVAKHPKKDKHTKRKSAKDKHSKHTKDMHAAKQDPTDRELTIELPKSVRKALNHSANEHGTTPERLVSLVISEWLDH